MHTARAGDNVYLCVRHSGVNTGSFPWFRKKGRRGPSHRTAFDEAGDLRNAPPPSPLRVDGLGDLVPGFYWRPLCQGQSWEAFDRNGVFLLLFLM